MQQTIFADKTREERVEILDANAQQIIKGNYTRKFTTSEKNQKRKRVCELELQLKEKNEELKAFKAAHKLETQPLTDELDQLLNEIKSGGEYVTGNLYKIIDRDKREVGFYNEDGELVEERKMGKEDNQLSIQEAFREAANG